VANRSTRRGRRSRSAVARRGGRRTPTPAPAGSETPPFQQERARRTYATLIEAAQALFSERGYDATGTPDIADHAGVSVGTFYRYFDDKKQIYLEVVRRHSERALTDIMAGLRPELFVGKARHETIMLAIDVLFGHVAAAPGLLRSFIEMSLRDPDVAAIQRQFDDDGRRQLTALMTAVVPRSVAPDPAATAFVIHAAATEVAFQVAGIRGQPPMAPAPVKEALCTLLERGLFSHPAGGGGSDRD
jgi:AcrR family transcriptional regulator